MAIMGLSLAQYHVLPGEHFERYDSFLRNIHSSMIGTAYCLIPFGAFRGILERLTVVCSPRKTSTLFESG